MIKPSRPAKKIEDPPILHGNHARVDPGRGEPSEYQFYAGIQQDLPEAKANLPITDSENVFKVKKFGDQNHK